MSTQARIVIQATIDIEWLWAIIEALELVFLSHKLDIHIQLPNILIS